MKMKVKYNDESVSKLAHAVVEAMDLKDLIYCVTLSLIDSYQQDKDFFDNDADNFIHIFTEDETEDEEE